MFATTALLYPCVLAALCLGAGLAVDRLSSRFLPAALLLVVGAATQIALSQLSTYISGLAPATPWLMLALAVAGFACSLARVLELARSLRAGVWPIAASLLAYAIALAPVLVAGRTSFSSYMALADSAVHMLGADYLLRHGQHYAHLDLRNSYGLFVNNYYRVNSYPSGADTLYGGSSFLLGLPLIWSFQPFNAYMLAVAVGPAWLLARKLGLNGPAAALAALTATLPALVYAYELFGSIKEITSLALVLALGCLVVEHRRWLTGPARGALAFALLVAAGVSALGTAFGVWALVAVVVLAAVLIDELRGGRVAARSLVAMVGGGALVLLVAAWPTWREAGGSLQVAQNIASTAKKGDLSSPLRAEQIVGVWLNGSYKLAPGGGAMLATYVLIVIALLAVALGLVHGLARRRSFALVAWLLLSVLAWLAVNESVTAWAAAKTLMLTSPVVVLMAWGGVAALGALPLRRVGFAAACVLAFALGGGVLASDALQYRSSNLAPTARYEELAKLDSRFAGQGPTLVTDFDEYAMYELREMDVGGPDFVYPPPALAGAATGYGHPVDLDRVKPSALLSYPLIVTRRDPTVSRPLAAYRLVWQGSYYQVWRRVRGAATALRHVALSGSAAQQCRMIGRVAGGASPSSGGRDLVAARAPVLVRVPLARSRHPRRWGRQRGGFVMTRPGRLRVVFRVPSGGVWRLWTQGQIMPAVRLSIDGRTVGSVAGQLDGNSLVPNTTPPISVALTAGAHTLEATRPAFNMEPGSEGAAVLDGVFLTPAGSSGSESLLRAPVARWRALCGRRYQWVELVPRVQDAVSVARARR